ncbi:MAG: PIG-L family deacetylase [Candidatus Bathyarchaeota archaeon]|nr:PIG-L family deacetylase [Candidatus Bathyarchaeota archaeon]
MAVQSDVILAVGAHPDDIELGCGGTLYKATKRGTRVIAIFLTKGEKSGKAETRVKESTDALHVLGVNEVYFEGFPDTEIPDSFRAVNYLEQFAVKYKPDVVFTHTVNDTHQDHRRVGWLSMSAFRNVPKILAYETPRVRPAHFLPSFFVDITGCVGKKSEALKCHVSQQEKRYLAYESTVNLASFRGSQVGVREAEAFEIVKYVDTCCCFHSTPCNLNCISKL